MSVPHICKRWLLQKKTTKKNKAAAGPAETGALKKKKIAVMYVSVEEKIFVFLYNQICGEGLCVFIKME